MNTMDWSAEESLEAMALAIVHKVLREGEATHEPGQWLGETISHHLEHAASHVEWAEDAHDWGYMNPEENWVEEAEHAICRLVMALYLNSNA